MTTALQTTATFEYDRPESVDLVRDDLLFIGFDVLYLRNCNSNDSKITSPCLSTFHKHSPSKEENGCGESSPTVVASRVGRKDELTNGIAWRLSSQNDNSAAIQ